MSTQTVNYNLEKPSQDEKYDIDVHNSNMDVIDSKLFELNEWKGARQFIITATNGNTYGAYPKGVSYAYVNSENGIQTGQTVNNNFPTNYGTITTININTIRFYQLFRTTLNEGGLYERRYHNGVWGHWRRVIEEDSTKLTRYTLADFGLTNSSFAGKTWEECALIIVKACPKARVVQYINTSSMFTNISSALGAERLPTSGTLRFEAGINYLNTNIPNKFEYNGNQDHGIFVGFYDNEWRPWRRLDSGDVYTTTGFTLSPAHMNCFVRVNATSDVTIVIPNDSSRLIPKNTDITIFQQNAGQITINPASGVTLWSDNSYRKSDGIMTAFTLRKIHDNYWVAIGRLAP